MKQRSPWRQMDIPELAVQAFGAAGLNPTYYERNVHDGNLGVIICEEPSGLHLAISHIKHNGEPGRCPTWEEVTHARTLLPPYISMVMHFKDDTTSEQATTTLHLFQWPDKREM